MAHTVQLCSRLLLYELYSTLFHFDPPTQSTICSNTILWQIRILQKRWVFACDGILASSRWKCPSALGKYVVSSTSSCSQASVRFTCRCLCYLKKTTKQRISCTWKRHRIFSTVTCSDWKSWVPFPSLSRDTRCIAVRLCCAIDSLTNEFGFALPQYY